jgi:hypothetical protein
MLQNSMIIFLHPALCTYWKTDGSLLLQNRAPISKFLRNIIVFDPLLHPGFTITMLDVDAATIYPKSLADCRYLGHCDCVVIEMD